MKGVLFALLFVFPLFSFSAGGAVLLVEKTWNLHTDEMITELRLNGTFLVENEYQTILQMNITGSGAEFEESNGTLRVVFNTDKFSGDKQITATALVRTSYPLQIPSNPDFSPSSANSSGLIGYGEDIASKAESLASGKETELEVVAAITDWAHGYITYDMEYWGDPSSAQAVFQEPRAVCVGYTHLFLSMLRSLGFETRFVSGYAFSEGWQPHAWAEVKICEAWVPVDPTFREVGALDARHVASSYSEDQSGVYDVLVARGNGFDFNSTVSVHASEVVSFDELLFVHTVLYGDDLRVTLYNPSSSYVTPTYEFIMPDFIIKKDKRILVIPPASSRELTYRLDTGDLETGYSHSIPYHIYVQGTLVEGEHTIMKGSPAKAEPQAEYTQPIQQAKEEPCPLFVFFVAFVFAILCIRD
jgi:hypothetical protein